MARLKLQSLFWMTVLHLFEDGDSSFLPTNLPSNLPSPHIIISFQYNLIIHILLLKTPHRLLLAFRIKYMFRDFSNLAATYCAISRCAFCRSLQVREPFAPSVQSLNSLRTLPRSLCPFLCLDCFAHLSSPVQLTSVKSLQTSHHH